MRTISKVVTSGVFALACLFLLAQSTYAQQEKGDKEVQFQAALLFGFGEDSSFKFGLANATLGYYVTRRAEIGAGVILTVQSAAGDTSVLAGPNAFLRYNFGEDGAKGFPYIGIEGGGFFSSGEDSIRAGFIRPNLGFKYFFKRNAAFDMNAGYTKAFASLSGGDSGNANIVDVRMGISFIF